MIKRDLQYAWRTLLRAPAFTFAVVGTLAIGIGATTAIFSIVNALLLRPLPYPESDRIVRVWQNHTERNGPLREWFTPPDFVDVRAQAGSFEFMASYGGFTANLTGLEEPQALNAGSVSPAYFDVFQVRPVLGAGFTREHETPGNNLVVALSHAVWVQQFGGDREIIGKRVTINDEAMTVVAVMPESFRDPLLNADLWRPRVVDPAASCQRGCYVTQVVGRLKPGVSVERANAETGVISQRLAAAYPQENANVTFWTIRLRDDLIASSRTALLALSGAVALLLLLAAVNIANLLVARSGVRERELAIRAAVGASRFAVVRQLLLETLMLSVIGAGAGTLVAFWVVDLLRSLAPAGTPRIGEVTVDGTALFFALGLAVLVTIIAGLGPALQTTRGRLSETLKESGGNRTTVVRRRTRSALVSSEVAIALMLLVGAGLLLKSLVRLQNVDAGFHPDGVLVASQFLPRGYDAERIPLYLDAVHERLRALPGVTAVGSTSILPMNGGDNDADFRIEGRPLRPDERPPVAWYRYVSPGYFQTMQIELAAGRAFTAADRRDAPRVVVVNETFARRYFPGENAVGKRLLLGSERVAEIVGVTRDVRQRGLDQAPVQEMYLAYMQGADRSVNVVVRAAGADPEALAPALRSALREVDPNLPVATFRPMSRIVDDSLALPRLYSAFFAFFAAVALGLAMVGIYGITSYAVAQRRQEIGIRMALGANQSNVVGMVVRQSMTIALAGLAAGLAGALALSRGLNALLFELSPLDLATYASVALLLFGVALLACWLPARRAVQVDPLTALRPE